MRMVVFLFWMFFYVTRRMDRFRRQCTVKPTHTNKYLDFSSHHPLAHKSSVVRTLCTRAKSLSSSQEYFSKEMSYVRSVLSQNDYPNGFVKKAAKTNIVSTPSATYVVHKEAVCTASLCTTL